MVRALAMKAAAGDGDFDILAAQRAQEVRRGIELDLDGDGFRRDFGEILRGQRDAVITRLAVAKFAFAQIGVVGRCHLGGGLANADLALEFKRVAGLFAVQLDRDRQLVGFACRGAGQRIAVDGESCDEAILARRAAIGRVADIERHRCDGFAGARLFQDHVGIAVHQAIDRGEIARLRSGWRGLRRALDLSISEAR
jgi:hypothetical protein